MNSFILRVVRGVLPVLLAITVVGCASAPIKLEQPPASVSVVQARTLLSDDNPADQLTGEQVLWGGTILNVANLSETTQVEVMGYPLDRQQRPQVQRAAQGRFVATFEGFVEPLDFPVGRVVTVLGALVEPISGTVGEATYVYPVIDVDDSHVWNPQELTARSGVTFGIGINLSN